MKRLIWKSFIFSSIFLFFSSVNFIGHAADEKLQKEIQTGVYSLVDLCQNALKTSESINIAKEDIEIAIQAHEKAFSVLYPRVTGFSEFKKYSEKKEIGGITAQPSWQKTCGISLSQSFTMNGKEFIVLRIADDLIKKGKYDLKAVKNSYLFQVVNSYYNVLQVQKAVEISQVNVNRLTSHKEAVETRLQLEEVSKTDLYRAQAELSKAKTDLIKAQNQLRMIKTYLARLAGVSSISSLREPESIDEYMSTIDLKKVAKQAINDRFELKSSDLQIKMANDQVKYYRSDYWPTVSWEGSYLYFDQEPAPTFDDSAYLALTISVPFFDGGLRKANIREALSKKKQAKLYKDALRKQIVLEVGEISLEISSQKDTIRSLNDQMQFAQENYDAVINQFKYGMAVSIDVMDANTLLLTTEQQLSEAQYTYKLAQMKLINIKGKLLSYIKGKIQGR